MTPARERRGAERAVVKGEIVDFGACMVRVAGHVGVSSLRELKDEILRMLRLGCSQLIVDLTRVGRLDPAALALLELTREVRMKRGTLALVCPDRELAAALEEHGFAVVSSVQEAHERFSLPADV